MSRVVVVGGGFAGLTAAAVLAARGHAVTLLEAAAGVGGKARAVETAGARVDLGPTLLTDLRPLQAVGAAVGVPLEAVADLARVDPALLVGFLGAPRLALGATPCGMAAALRDALGRDAFADWARFLDLGARAARLADHFYARGDVDGPRDLAGFLLGGGVSPRDLGPFARHGSLASLLAAKVRTPELRRFLGHFARFVGLDATQAPAVTVVIPYLVATAGVFHPRGGIAALADALLELGLKHGVAAHTSDPVVELEVSGRAVRAVRTAQGRRLVTDACVAAVDAAATARWLPGTELARRVRRLRPTVAARVAWWVVEAPPELPVHHALHFPAEAGVEPLYVATPTVTDATLAPPRTTVLHALVHGPAGEPAGPGLAGALRERLVAAGQWPSGRVLAAGVAGGEAACYGYAIGPGLLSSFRLAPRVPGVGNLFLAGGTVFPGPGLANVMRSGLRAAALVEAALGGRGA